MLHLLNTFEQASGQKVNLLKSSVFFNSNVRNEVKEGLCQILQMGEANERSTYMGLPNMLGRNKSSTIGFLKDKVKKRVLHSWEDKIISQAGREELIKSVAQTLPSYAMSIILLPLDITKDMERSLTKFWWSSKIGMGKRIS